MPTASFAQPSRLGKREDGINDLPLGVMLHKAAAKLAQDGVVKTALSEFQAEQVFPVNAGAYRISSLSVGQAFPELEQRDECQTNRRCCRLTLCGKAVSEVGIRKEHCQLIVHPHHEVAVGEDGTSNARGVLRNAIDGLWLE